MNWLLIFTTFVLQNVILFKSWPEIRVQEILIYLVRFLRCGYDWILCQHQYKFRLIHLILWFSCSGIVTQKAFDNVNALWGIFMILTLFLHIILIYIPHTSLDVFLWCCGLQVQAYWLRKAFDNVNALCGVLKCIYWYDPSYLLQQLCIIHTCSPSLDVWKAMSVMKCRKKYGAGHIRHM